MTDIKMEVATKSDIYENRFIQSLERELCLAEKTKGLSHSGLKNLLEEVYGVGEITETNYDLVRSLFDNELYRMVRGYYIALGLNIENKTENPESRVKFLRKIFDEYNNDKSSLLETEDLIYNKEKEL